MSHRGPRWMHMRCVSRAAQDHDMEEMDVLPCKRGLHSLRFAWLGSTSAGQSLRSPAASLVFSTPQSDFSGPIWLTVQACDRSLGASHASRLSATSSGRKQPAGCRPRLKSQGWRNFLGPPHQHLRLYDDGGRHQARGQVEGHQRCSPSAHGRRNGQDKENHRARAPRATPPPPDHRLLGRVAVRPMRLGQHESSGRPSRPSRPSRPGRSCP
jgi:hypothetical protein